MDIPVPGRGNRTERARIQLASAHRVLLGVVALALLTLASVLVWGPGMEFPKDVGRTTGRAIDDAVHWMTVNGAGVFDLIRNVIIRVLIALGDALLWLPWPAFIAGVGLLAWRAVSWRVALFSAASLLLMGFMGLWPSAMETLALILTAVILAVAIGLPLGVLGARSNLADGLMRPVLDGMQTMPSFVYLVPAILFFSLGNVPAIIATLIYSVPPVIRLTNLGIRQVSPELVEASRSFGATSRQILLKVQVPLALPTIMAGINQTTMMALAMVVIASLVGAGGLGEDVLRGLGRQEPGNALLGGLGIVFLAIIIDRVTQAMARARKEAAGIGAT